MSKFMIECPNCGRYAEAKTGFFARKKIDCNCGHTINIRTERMVTRTCPHCGNKGITAKFCGECGCKKPEPKQTWDCPECGNKDITAKFCPECGHKRG